jgi:hypothetical protein
MAGRPRKTASVTTEVVLGQAAQNLKKAVAELGTAFENVKILETKGEELTLLVSNKEDEIAALETKFAEIERQMTIDLELKMKSNAESTVNENLRARGMTTIPVTELNALRTELQQVKDNMEKTINAEVGKAKGMAESRFEQEKRLLESEHKGAQAENSAKIVALEEKVKFLTEQSVGWEKQLNSERAASVERAKASAVGSIQVGSGYNGK